jgi:hypothetical protein
LLGELGYFEGKNATNIENHGIDFTDVILVSSPGKR